MKTSQIIDGVKVISVNGKLELHIPKNFDGKTLQNWKDKNKAELDKLRAEK